MLPASTFEQYELASWDRIRLIIRDAGCAVLVERSLIISISVWVVAVANQTGGICHVSYQIFDIGWIIARGLVSEWVPSHIHEWEIVWRGGVDGAVL